MDTSNFETKLKGALSKSAKVSKEAFSKAGNAIQNFSDKSVLKIERQQLKDKRAKKYEELGQTTSELFISDNTLIEAIKKMSEGKENILGLLDKISTLQNEIAAISTEIAEKDEALESESKNN